MVKHGEHGDTVRPHNVEDEIWEPRHHRASDPAVYIRIRFRMAANSFETLPQGDQKFVSEASAL